MNIEFVKIILIPRFCKSSKI